ENEIGLHLHAIATGLCREFVFVKTAFVIPEYLRIDTANRQVHLGEPPGGVVALLPIDRDVADTAAVLEHELLALHEHAPRAAAGVIDASRIRFQHFHQRADNRARGIELAAALAFRACELAEEIFVDTAEHI